MENDIDSGLSPMERRDLHRIAGMMIPADAGYDLPSASDPIIFADTLATLGPDRADILDALAALSIVRDLDDARAEIEIHTYLNKGTRAAITLGRIVLQSYYRNDRVLRALGQEARAPFPKGYTLEQGDWSLLDSVKQRPQLWRNDR
jgi:hypothetical protein